MEILVVIAKRKAMFFLNVFLKCVYLGSLRVWMPPHFFVVKGHVGFQGHLD
jgi:hypothetical protein